MKAKREIEKVMETRTLPNLSKHNWLGLARITKKCLPLLVLVAVAVAGSILLGGSLWWWLAGVFVGKLVARLLLTIALAVILYFLIYLFICASIIGGVLWILIG